MPHHQKDVSEKRNMYLGGSWPIKLITIPTSGRIEEDKGT
jgi:hypothetical protein